MNIERYSGGPPRVITWNGDPNWYCVNVMDLHTGRIIPTGDVQVSWEGALALGNVVADEWNEDERKAAEATAERNRTALRNLLLFIAFTLGMFAAAKLWAMLS